MGKVRGLGSNQHREGIGQSGRVVVKALELGSGSPLNCWALGKCTVSQDRSGEQPGGQGSGTEGASGPTNAEVHFVILKQLMWS